jgi:hypothetical protein
MPKLNVRTTALKRRTDKVPSGVGEQTVETDAIARRAYERFEQRGREHGHDVEDWLDAERELHARRPAAAATPASALVRATEPLEPVNVE